MPRRILMTADTVGGVWTYALELARALPEVQIALATMGRALSPDQTAEAQAIPNLEVYESTYRLEWMEHPWEDVARAGEWLLEVESRVRPDLVHLNGYAHATLPWRAPCIVAAHSCVLSWWRAVKGESAPAAWNRYRDVVRNGLLAAAEVVAPSHAMLAALRESYPGAVSSGCVIPNGRSYQFLQPGAKDNLILAAGRLWDEAKNIGALAHSARRLPWPVYVAGDGDTGNRVQALGRLAPAELAQWYGRASIYALPARYEPFGLSVLEAALSGCVLVLGDIPSLRENWQDAAAFVEPGDAHALEKTLVRLISDPRERARLRARALARAGRFTVERMAAEYRRLYSAVLTAGREAKCA